MFTGIIEDIGVVQWLRRSQKTVQLLLTSHFTKRVRRGDSISINGCCLTVTSHRDDKIGFELLEETLERTNLSALKPDSRVNLERAMRVDGRINGHFVQGHVDCVGMVSSLEAHGGDHRLEIHFPSDFSQYVAYKGSVGVNGVSLTVAEAFESSFVCWIIPFTHEHTNLSQLAKGDQVNLEFDVLAKYVERMLRAGKED